MSRLLLVSAAALLVGLPSALASGTTTSLVATVGPASTISLKTHGGQPVTVLKPGSYTIVVRDRSKRLNFHLKGPTNGLSPSTTLKFTGNVSWHLRLARGKYQYFSDRGGSLLRKSFRVA